jgi:single-strand DNA-binding protein
LRKGSKVYLEGSIETRSFDKDGEKRHVTEIVIRPFNGSITLLDRKPDDAPQQDDASRPAARQRRGAQAEPGGRR